MPKRTNIKISRQGIGFHDCHIEEERRAGRPLSKRKVLRLRRAGYREGRTEENQPFIDTIKPRNPKFQSVPIPKC